MSNRTHGQGEVGHLRGLSAVFAAALVFAAAVACAAQTQSADGTRASEKKAAAAASGDKYESNAAASKGAAPAVAPKVGEAAPDFKLPYATQ